jgi:hypothetical protein
MAFAQYLSTNVCVPDGITWLEASWSITRIRENYIQNNEIKSSYLGILAFSIDHKTLETLDISGTYPLHLLHPLHLDNPPYRHTHFQVFILSQFMY